MAKKNPTEFDIEANPNPRNKRVQPNMRLVFFS
jgi:hypothetical protein